MAEEKKAGESKLFQLVVLIITTIVAPVSVYVLTHSFDQKTASPAATLPPTVVMVAELPTHTTAPTLALTATPETALTTPAEAALTATETATAVFTPTNTEIPATATSTITATIAPSATNTALPSPTAAGTLNPQGNIPAGSVVVANDYSLVMNVTDVHIENNTISLNLQVQNLSSKQQTFTYSVQNIIVKDDTGRVYEALYGEKKDACNQKDTETLKKIDLKPNQSVTIHSVTLKDAQKWCGRDSRLLIPLYAGPVAEQAKSLLITFNGFGGFQGFSFEVPR